MKVLILYEVLGNIITGGTDKVAQETSCIVLDKLLELLVKVDEREMLLIIGQKFFQNIFFVKAPGLWIYFSLSLSVS